VDQIMALPSLPGLASTATGDFQIAGCILLLAARRWAATCRDMRKADAPGWLRTVMAAVARRAGTPATSGDATGTADGANGSLDHLAEKVLRDILLSAPSGELALGPSDGPGALLSRACLFLARRGMPRDAPDGRHITTTSSSP
jgi:hypothetical protein